MHKGNSSSPLSIGKLSRQSGVKVETIRYYERIGLLPEPPRSTSGYRQYARQHLAKLSFIRRGRELGFPLNVIRTLLELENGEVRCAEVQGIARNQIGQLEDRIRDLERLKDALVGVEQRCQGVNSPSCPVIDALRGCSLT